MSQPQPVSHDLIERLTDEIMDEITGELGYLTDYARERFHTLIKGKMYHLDDVAYNEGVCDGQVGTL